VSFSDHVSFWCRDVQLLQADVDVNAALGAHSLFLSDSLLFSHSLSHSQNLALSRSLSLSLSLSLLSSLLFSSLLSSLLFSSHYHTPGYVFEAITLTRHQLKGRVPLIGFAGGPVCCVCVVWCCLCRISVMSVVCLLCVLCSLSHERKDRVPLTGFAGGPVCCVRCLVLSLWNLCDVCCVSVLRLVLSQPRAEGSGPSHWLCRRPGMLCALSGVVSVESL
jgi:hypothetical protein